ncbi:hypothetical protein HON03_02925 [archaeon]|jgi:hypothetical protein|nr:hypothetical protein [archaeon]MBT5287736.1 hypothetical protein [archaeon]
MNKKILFLILGVMVLSIGMVSAETCATNADCADGLYCDNQFYYDTYACVECIPGESQCDEGYSCTDYVCVEEETSITSPSILTDSEDESTDGSCADSDADADDPYLVPGIVDSPSIMRGDGKDSCVSSLLEYSCEGNTYKSDWVDCADEYDRF